MQTCLSSICTSLNSGSVVGERIVGADGVVYEIVVDPKTGKKMKK